MTMISVVIPAYNEVQVINKALASVAGQDFPGKFEVIVVDNNSSDGTAEAAKKFHNQLNLKIISEARQGRGAARATGFAAAQGDIICSTDADTIVPPNWLREITTPLSKSGVIAVAGTSKIDEGTALQNKIFNWLQPRVAMWFQKRHGYIWLTGCNSAVKKSAYQTCGGFKPDLNALEDVEIAERLTRHGRILLVTHIPVVSSARRFQHGLIRGLLHYARAYIEMYVFKKSHTHLSDVR